MIDNIKTLPNEIIIEIISYLDIITQFNFSRTCLSFYNIYNNKLKHKNFLYKCSTNEWIQFISFIKKCIDKKYKLFLDNKIKEKEYMFIIVNINNIYLFDYYKKETLKFIQIYDFIKYINNCKHNTIVFFTHKVRTPLNLKYIIFNNMKRMNI
jgi:hypothetical protein